MTKFAVVKIKGQQFKVSKGDEILVGKLSEKEPGDARGVRARSPAGKKDGE